MGVFTNKDGERGDTSEIVKVGTTTFLIYLLVKVATSGFIEIIARFISHIKSDAIRAGFPPRNERRQQ